MIQAFDKNIVILRARAAALRSVKRSTYNLELAELVKRIGPDSPFIRVLEVQTRQRLEANQAALVEQERAFKELRSATNKYLPPWLYRAGVILFTCGEAGAMYLTLEAFQDAKPLGLIDLLTSYAIRAVLTLAMTGLMYLGSKTVLEAWVHRHDPNVSKSQNVLAYLGYGVLITLVGSMRYLSLEVGTPLFNLAATILTAIGPALLAAHASLQRSESKDLFDRKRDANREITNLRRAIERDDAWLEIWSTDQVKAEVFRLVYRHHYDEGMGVRSATPEACQESL